MRKVTGIGGYSLNTKIRGELKLLNTENLSTFLILKEIKSNFGNPTTLNTTK
jgi:hypothetical protein